jgi:ATP-dependent DNA helicase RecQ
MLKSQEILKKYWGYDQFRPAQEEIIDDVVYGHDVLALLPTGGGKSICFQVPGLIREGMTLVISPLIALMQDQVNNLQHKGIRAKAIVSGMSYREIDITLDNAQFGGLDFLYTSPERIQSSLFIERFKRMNVGLIVVDEAHCICEWGHDFRPSFKEIYKLRQYHPTVPVIALTATATVKVREDIIDLLTLKNPKVHESNFERKNLSYNTYYSENKLNEILNFTKKNSSECGIIYCQTRKSVKEIARLLHANKINIGIYHGGMTKDDRTRMLHDWMTEKINVMVATNAFGMGIDKSNVRYVIHYEFPLTLEAYFQEAGRAGRDGNESTAIAWWEKKDIDQLKVNHDQKYITIELIKKSYQALFNFLKIAFGSGKDETYHFDIQVFCRNFDLKLIETYSAFRLLELNGDLTFSEGVFHPTKVKFAVGNLALYNFQIKHPVFLPLTTLLVRSYPGIFDSYFELNEQEFSKRLKIAPVEIENQLAQLEKYGILDVSWRSSLPMVTFLKERLPDSYFTISESVYQTRKMIAAEKLDAVVQFLEKNECRSIQILNYFGQTSKKCGKCDVCVKEGKTQFSLDELKDKIIRLLADNLKTDDIVTLTNGEKEQVIQALKELLLDQKISYDGSYYFLKN